jgi:hypothetical protein
MPRPLHDDTINILDDSYLEYFHLYEFYFSTPVYLTDYYRAIVYGGKTYHPSASIEGYSAVKENIDINNNKVTISMSAADGNNIRIALNEYYTNKRIVIYRGFFDGDGQTDEHIVANPFIIFDGRVDSYSIEDDPIEGKSSVTWNISSHWADWEKTQGRTCTQNNAKLHYPNEDGFKFIYKQIGNKIWGKVTS